MPTWKLYEGDCLEVMRQMPDNSFDAVVTDPPYGLSREPDIEEVLTKWMAGEDYEHRGGGFMGKTWDSFVPGPSVWREVYRVLKPGGHALVFAGTRTQDLMTTALRLAGFEVRDVIEWLYFNGFPKSMDISKAIDKKLGAERTEGAREWSGGQRAGGIVGTEKTNLGTNTRVIYDVPATLEGAKWQGWGTALKPAHEPIIMVRKPPDGAVVDNVERWGTGALNINGCRIGDEEVRSSGEVSNAWREIEGRLDRQAPNPSVNKGRFPANCVTTEPDAFFSKYFNVTPPELCKKASKQDRNSDWRGKPINLPDKPAWTYGEYKGTPEHATNMHTKRANNHPTVKPTDLMAWLVRLITPPGGIVLDPFAGSGSTLVAAKREGFQCIGIEREPEYCDIIRKRMAELQLEGKETSIAFTFTKT
jgi:DNA modification methylase